MRITPRKVICASMLLLLLAAAGAGAYTTSRRSQEPQESPEPRKVHVPKRFISEAKRLKVESHWIKNGGTPAASLVVVIRNKSDLAVTSVSVTVAGLTITRDGGLAVDEPVTVIEPFGTKELMIPVTNFTDDSPLVISAALYADGTEEGRAEVLKWTREDREEQKAKRAAKKEGPEQ